MRVLVTNDDGIEAEGLDSLRIALKKVEGLEVHVIAPDSNRSATARSITTRTPLWAQEIHYEDGSKGFATDGTPVDCVRFADLGLIGERPDLIVSGINHGSNLGDDITYSGTVAAALEGIVLGIPSIAVSQQSAPGEMGYIVGRSFDFRAAARITAGLVERAMESGLPEGTLLNVNVPADPPSAVVATKLGKRIYDDEMKLVDEDGDARRRYRIYGFQPSFEEEEGTDLQAISDGQASVTPIHFDLTDHGGIETLREWDLETLLA